MRISPIGATLAIIGILLSNSANAQTISWQDHRINAATFWGVANAITASKKIADETQGKLQIRVFPASSSGFKPNESLDAISQNLLNMGAVWGSHVAGQEQVMEMLDLPDFVPGDTEFRFKLWDAMLPLYKAYIEKRYDVVVLDMFTTNPRRLFTKKPVQTLADIQGMKIRAIGPADGAFIKTLGAEPTTTNWNELYTALQQGVVDGHMAVDVAQTTMRFYEVTNYIYDTANAGPVFFIMVNKPSLDKLPADVREKFLAAQLEVRKANRAAYEPDDKKARQDLLKRGMKVNPVSAADQATMRQASTRIVEDWARKLNPDGKKIYEAAKSMIDTHSASSR
jgi:TRAP-type C4-dicarboxylate transport system substrate-binding protein